MSNNYNQTLQSNNIDLQAILDIINELPEAGSGGDTSMEDGLITGKLTSYSYTNDRVTTIRNEAFKGFTSLNNVNFPAVTYVGDSAFTDCRSLATASFPLVSSTGVHAFNGCGFETINFPSLTYINTMAFAYCQKIISATFPVASYIGSSAFSGCTSLTTLIFPKVTYIGKSAFYYSPSFTSIYLLGSSLCTLYGGPFNSTQITSITGSIFVPASLLASYKIATNWAYFSNRIFPYGLIDVVDNIIVSNIVKNIIINTRFLNVPTDISITFSDTEDIDITNIQATTSTVTFDIISYDDTEREVEINISVIDNGEIHQAPFRLQISNQPIGLPTSQKVRLNSTQTINIPLYGGITPDNVNIISADNNILTISNFTYDSNNISCEVITHDIESSVNLNIVVNYGDTSFTREIDLTVAVPLIEYDIENITTDYGFTLNSDGYYESNNNNNYTYAMCKLNITASHDCTMHLDCINHATSYTKYNFGMLSNLDTTLLNSADIDTDNVYKSFINMTGTTTETVSYQVPAGEHFIYIKFKNYYSSGSSTNDYSLQFKVRFE